MWRRPRYKPTLLYLDKWIKLFQNLNIKTAVYKALLNGCKGKPTCSLCIKPLQAFHASCLRGILRIRCKSMLGKGTNWTASATVYWLSHVVLTWGQDNPDAACHAIQPFYTWQKKRNKRCCNEDDAQVSMTKWEHSAWDTWERTGETRRDAAAARRRNAGKWKWHDHILGRSSPPSNESLLYFWLSPTVTSSTILYIATIKSFIA